MADNRARYASPQQTIAYEALGEPVSLEGLPFVFLGRITVRAFLILLLIYSAELSATSAFAVNASSGDSRKSAEKRIEREK